jgi:hypothetical protein
VGKYVANVAGHAGVGCLSAVASGGSCKAGALAAGAGAAVAPVASQGGLVGGTAISGLAGGLGSLLGGGKFQDGAVTGAFGYLFNAWLHITDVGNDAHNTLLQAAEQSGDKYFGNVWSPPGDSDTWFGGRPDLGDRDALLLWEIKPNNAVQIAAGVVQVEVYSIIAGATGQPYVPADFLPDFFHGGSLTLLGQYGFYTYTFAEGGVITYNTELYQNNVVVPMFVPVSRPRSDGPGSYPFMPPLPPLIPVIR